MLPILDMLRELQLRADIVTFGKISMLFEILPWERVSCRLRITVRQASMPPPPFRAGGEAGLFFSVEDLAPEGAATNIFFWVAGRG